MDDWNLQYLAYIHSPDWETKRQQTFEIFGRACFKCRSRRELQIHHKTYERFRHERVETDLIPLCRPCHKGLHAFCKRRGLTVALGTAQYLNPAPRPWHLAKKLRSLLDLAGLMRRHDLSEKDARALIEIGAL